MKVKLLRSYRSQKGNVTFVYTVSGNAKELEAFKIAQGDFYREDTTTGAPLWFTTRYIRQTGNLIITSKGKIVPDMSEFDQAASLASQYNGDFGNELAKAAAAKLLDNKANVSTTVETPAIPTVDADLNNL